MNFHSNQVNVDGRSQYLETPELCIVNQECFLSSSNVFEIMGNELCVHELRQAYLHSAIKALDSGSGIILESPTQQAATQWAKAWGFDANDVYVANYEAIHLMDKIRQISAISPMPKLVSASIGPRHVTYNFDKRMSPNEASSYHEQQIRIFTQTPADLISAVNMNNVEEAVGIALTAHEAELPVTISFAVDSNGKTACGRYVGEAIEIVDWATENIPLFYMIDRLPARLFEDALSSREAWPSRIRGVHGNNSRLSPNYSSLFRNNVKETIAAPTIN